MTTTMPAARVLLSGAAAILMTFSLSTMTVAAKPIRVQTMTPTLGLAAPGGGQLKDEQCGPNHVPCGPAFEKWCKDVLKGTMSGKQDWGGKTCWTPS